MFKVADEEIWISVGQWKYFCEKESGIFAIPWKGVDESPSRAFDGVLFLKLLYGGTGYLQPMSEKGGGSPLAAQ